MPRFVEAVNEALTVAMAADPRVLFFGLGATDPRRMFGSSAGLVERFGPDRVFDMPTAENGMTGVAVGAALQGFPVVMTHLRLDFFLLAMDQLVNSAAKWHYMFGGQDSVPLTIRLVLGRGWGQGPTHSQNLQAWFAHVPGLKVVAPSTPEAAKGLLLSSIFDPNPVIFLEHRWLHDQVGDVPAGDIPLPLGRARLLARGSDVTLVGSSHMSLEALHAQQILARTGIGCDVVDLGTLSPLDWPTLEASLRRTGRLLALEPGTTSFGVAAEIVASAATRCFDALVCAPRRLGSPDHPLPTSPALAAAYYPRTADIVRTVLEMLERRPELDHLVAEAEALGAAHPHDVPGDWFKGPF